MISWSLLTAHRIPKIALQLMRGLYGGQQRPLISITTQFLFMLLCSGLYGLETPINLFEIIESEQRVFS
jgi:hypothetical protein